MHKYQSLKRGSVLLCYRFTRLETSPKLLMVFYVLLTAHLDKIV